MRTFRRIVAHIGKIRVNSRTPSESGAQQRDAMPNGGKLTIETQNAYLDDTYAEAHPEVIAGQYVMIAITDIGTGMPPEIAAAAFEPFFTTKVEGQGTGLGLSQVYGFIKQSGGHTKIYSEVDQGTSIKAYRPDTWAFRPLRTPLKTSRRTTRLLQVRLRKLFLSSTTMRR